MKGMRDGDQEERHEPLARKRTLVLEWRPTPYLGNELARPTTRFGSMNPVL